MSLMKSKSFPGRMRQPRAFVTVAVVDDDRDSREQVESFLSAPRSYFQCVGFESPEEFYRSRIKLFDLMLFDECFYGTREHRGGDLVKYSLQRYPGVPIIIYTNWPDPASNPMADHVAGFVDKFKAIRDPSCFRAEVRRALNFSPRLKGTRLNRAKQSLKKKDSRDKPDGDCISRITMGDVIYPFQTPLVVTAEWSQDMKGCSLFLKDYPGFLLGRGPDRSAARSAFYARFHERYTELFSRSEIYDSPDDRADRDKLMSIVNKERYDNLRTIFVPYWYGQIKDVSSDGIRTIAWWEGPTTMHGLDEVPTLANLRKGDWVRAAVVKRLATSTIVQVINVVATGEPKFSFEQRQALWNAGTTAT
jgi:hypothetical protein